MLPTFLKPYHVDNNHLTRIGPKLDGGYVVDKRSIQESNTIITCGLNDDWEFEKSFLKKNDDCKVIAFDHTIDRKFWINRFKKDIRHFFLLKKIRLRKIIGIFKYLDYINFFKNNNKHHIIKIGPQNINQKEITISKILENQSNVILKIDIEGDEYKILNEIISNSEKITSLIIEFHNIHNAGIHQRPHRIRQHICGFIHSLIIVCNIHPHRLFSHRTLVCVSGRLIVFGEWNTRCEDAKYGTRMNLAVGIFIYVISLALC